MFSSVFGRGSAQSTATSSSNAPQMPQSAPSASAAAPSQAAAATTTSSVVEPSGLRQHPITPKTSPSTSSNNSLNSADRAPLLPPTYTSDAGRPMQPATPKGTPGPMSHTSSENSTNHGSSSAAQVPLGMTQSRPQALQQQGPSDEQQQTSDAGNNKGAASSKTSTPNKNAASAASSAAAQGPTVQNDAAAPPDSAQVTVGNSEESVDQNGSSVPPPTANLLGDEDGKTAEHVARSVISMALPFAVAYAGSYSISLVGLMFAGKFSVAEASGYGLAIMISNAIGYSVISGLTGGLDPMVSQAFGIDPRHPKISIFCQRALVCFAILIVPIGILFWTSQRWMSYLHLGDPDVIAYAAPQLRLQILALPAWLLWDILQCVLASSDSVRETVVGYLASAIFNPIILYVVVDYLHVGYEGLIMSFVCVSWFMVIVTGSYTYFITKQLDGIYQGWDSANAMIGWKPLLFRAFPSMFVLLCVWTASEVNVLMSSNLVSREEFAAAAICQQIISLMYSVPSAISYAVIVKVGNYLGAGEKESAKLSVKVGVVLTLFWALIASALMIGVRYEIAAFFTADEVVQDAVMKALPYLALFFTVDTLLAALSSGLRGAGVPHRVAASAAIGWVIGITLALLMHRADPHLGLAAFYLGPAIGLLFGNLVCLYCLLTSTWELQEDMIQELLVNDSNKKKTE